jgi:hypothetical protein
MADPNLLASIISGTNPLAPQMLGSYLGAQQADAATNPTYGHNEGPFGALAKTLMGFQGGNALRQGVQSTTAANTAAMPDLARLLANPDPYAQLAQGGANPIAASRLLQGATPETAANARNLAAQAALAQLNVKGFQGIQPGGAGAAVPAGKYSGAALGATSPIISGTGASSPFAGATSYPGLVVEGADPVAAVMGAPAEQWPAMIAKMNKAQRAALAAKLNAGGANAARPPT